MVVYTVVSSLFLLFENDFLTVDDVEALFGLLQAATGEVVNDGDGLVCALNNLYVCMNIILDVDVHQRYLHRALVGRCDVGTEGLEVHALVEGEELSLLDVVAVGVNHFGKTFYGRGCFGIYHTGGLEHTYHLVVGARCCHFALHGYDFHTGAIDRDVLLVESLVENGRVGFCFVNGREDEGISIATCQLVKLDILIAHGTEGQADGAKVVGLGCYGAIVVGCGGRETNGRGEGAVVGQLKILAGVSRACFIVLLDNVGCAFVIGGFGNDDESVVIACCGGHLLLDLCGRDAALDVGFAQIDGGGFAGNHFGHVRCAYHIAFKLDSLVS